MSVTYIVYVKSTAYLRPSSAAWARLHDQHRVSRDVLTRVERYDDPDQALVLLEEVEAAFGDLEAYLAHLRWRWQTAVAAADGPPGESLTREDVETALRPVRMVLDRFDPESAA